MDLRVQLAWTLLVLLVLIPAIVAVTRLAAGRGGRMRPGKGALRILAAVPLAPQRTVYVIDMGVRILVVGSAQSDVKLLTEIDDADEMEKLRGLLTGGGAAEFGGPDSGAGAAGFDALLRQVRTRLGKQRD